MIYADFKAKTNKWNVFNQIDTLGSFDFYTGIVTLDAINKEDIFDIKTMFNEIPTNLTPAQYSVLSKVIPLAVHEYTHFIDATSTLWGLMHLNLMNKAYLSNHVLGGTEKDFFKAKLFYDHIRSLKLPNYYTVVTNESNALPWLSEITIGRIFGQNGIQSQKTVLFSRFSNSDKKFLARSPISTISLLEASAMAQELILHSSLIEKTSNDFQLVEGKIFSSNTLSHIYNPKITEYSVCVHILANIQKCPDILSAFRLCSRLTRLVLNFPEKMFNKLIYTCPINDILKIDKKTDFEYAMRDGIVNKNYGVLYFLLCNALPPKSYENSQTIESGLRTAITTLGLQYNEIEKEAKNQARELYSTINASPIASISNLAKAGYENFCNIGLDRDILNFDSINLPPVFLDDLTQIDIFPSQKNSLKEIDLEVMFNELYKGQSWVERFSEACI